MPRTADKKDIFIDTFIKAALLEDIGPGDNTSCYIISPEKQGEATVLAKENLILSGTRASKQVFASLDAEIRMKQYYEDGASVSSGEVILSIEGKLRPILAGERVALNFLQHLSGIASFTRKFVSAVEGFPVTIVDTRKTTPLWRSLEKEAVQHGGGKNHRFGLFDGILIKDNHIAAAGGVEQAVSLVKERVSHLLKIEIEVENLSDLHQAIEAGADVVLLDNMSPEEIKEAVSFSQGKVILEASGGINLQNIRQFASTGVDIISIGVLTHSAPAVDMSLEINSVK